MDRGARWTLGSAQGGARLSFGTAISRNGPRCPGASARGVVRGQPPVPGPLRAGAARRWQRLSQRHSGQWRVDLNAAKIGGQLACGARSCPARSMRRRGQRGGAERTRRGYRRKRLPDGRHGQRQCRPGGREDRRAAGLRGAQLSGPVDKDGAVSGKALNGQGADIGESVFLTGVTSTGSVYLAGAEDRRAAGLQRCAAVRPGRCGRRCERGTR